MNYGIRCAIGSTVSLKRNSLICDSPLPIYSDTVLPQGNYANSCKNVKLLDGVLTANCSNPDGTSTATSLGYATVCKAYSPVSFINGKLTCGDSLASNNYSVAIPQTGNYFNECEKQSTKLGSDGILTTSCFSYMGKMKVMVNSTFNYGLECLANSGINYDVNQSKFSCTSPR
jgi:hypothetical protein